MSGALPLSTEWHYRIDLPLSSEAPKDVEAVLSRLSPLVLALEPVIDVGQADAPIFGPGFHWAGRDFASIKGATVLEGRLKLGIWCQNLESEFHDLEDPEIVPRPGVSRLKVLLEQLSMLSGALPGDVVGCIASESDDIFHAHPIVVGLDGLVRIAWTDTVLDMGWMQSDAEALPVVDRLPLHCLVERDAHSMHIDLDVLTAALRPAEAMVA